MIAITVKQTASDTKITLKGKATIDHAAEINTKITSIKLKKNIIFNITELSSIDLSYLQILLSFIKTYKSTHNIVIKTGDSKLFVEVLDKYGLRFNNAFQSYFKSQEG